MKFTVFPFISIHSMLVIYIYFIYYSLNANKQYKIDNSGELNCIWYVNKGKTLTAIQTP